MSLRSKTSFRTQLTWALTVGIFCVALLSSLAVSTLSSRASRDNFIQQGLQVTENFAANSRLALLYGAGENAAESVRATLAFPDVFKVRIVDMDGNELVSDGNPVSIDAPAQVPRDHASLVAENGKNWLFRAPVTTAADPQVEESPFAMEKPEVTMIGFVEVVTSKATLDGMVQGVFLGNGLISLGSAIVLVIMLRIITNRMTNPLQTLADEMARAEAGESGVRAEMLGPKDIQQMGAAFNKMMVVLEDREGQLKEARDDAIRSAQVKAEFTANVSHEIRTPMNGMLGMLQLLENSELGNKEREYVRVARSSGETLLSLINDILDFSKIEAGKLDVESLDFDLRRMLDEIVELLAAQAQQKDLELGCLMTGEVPTALRAEPTRLRQVLTNLINNAIKFTEGGEVAVRVKLVNQHQSIATLLFEIQDTGIGISAEAQSRIFDSFSQADGSTTREYGGTGLGLTICRQLVELMGGTIGVRSELGSGSTFWFTITAEVQRTYVKPLPRHPLPEKRALMVLPGVIARDCVANELQQWEVEVEQIDSGRNALEVLSEAATQGKTFNLLIVDMMLAGMGSTELVRAIKCDSRLQDIQIVMITRQGWPAHGSGSRGIAAYINKPIRQAQLYQVFAQVFDESGITIEMPEPVAVEQTLEIPRFDANILIVEDNRANQQVIVGMLERFGCVATVAGDGQDAMELLEDKAFDLIFMDCNMPRMDGYEATKQIRKLKNDKATTPIIAMTANALSGDADRCYAAGMDDYMEKPLVMRVVQGTLTRWLGKNDGEATKSTDVAKDKHASAMVVAETADSLDMKQLNELREMIGSRFNKMIEVFLEDTPVYMESLQEALTDDDAETLMKVGHSIKGSSKNLGANRLGDLARDLELLGRDGSTQGAHDILAKVYREFEHVKELLTREVAEPTQETPENTENNSALVLIVDDDRSMRFALRHVLQRDGYRIEEAADGQEAVDRFKDLNPDMVLMDAIMPGMDGFTACRQLREINPTHPPILVVTALDDESSVEKAFSAGANDFIAKPIHFAVLRQRVTRMLESSQNERHAIRLANNDTLTGLPNRSMFVDHLEQRIEQAGNGQHMLAVLMLDLDRFKNVNDTLGHNMGDNLLKEVAERLAGCVADNHNVARMGGDEFAILLERIVSRKAAAAVADKIHHVLSEPFCLNTDEVYVTASVGIALYPDDGKDLPTLLKHADTAMYQAKDKSQAYAFYEPAMEAAVGKTLELESNLRRAISRNEFVVYYQPHYSLHENRVVGMEALVRWQHPVRGLIGPGEFIELAENAGLISELGQWVLRKACEQAMTWQEAGFDSLRIDVNLSGKQLEEGGMDVVEMVATILNETQLDPSRLGFEITENTLIQHTDQVISTLNQLRDMGLRLAVDDFGTGYSSLGYLRRFPVDTLKIDQAFISDLGSDNHGGAIVSGIISLAHTLKLKVIAEGVETQPQLDFLRQAGCDEVQGQLISKPLPASIFEQRILRQGNVQLPAMDNVASLSEHRSEKRSDNAS